MREREHEGLQLPEHLPPPLVVEEELGANAGPVPGSVHVPVDCVAEIRHGLASFLGAVPAREIGVPEASLLVDLSVLLEEAVEALGLGPPDPQGGERGPCEVGELLVPRHPLGDLASTLHPSHDLQPAVPEARPRELADEIREGQADPVDLRGDRVHAGAGRADPVAPYEVLIVDAARQACCRASPARRC